MSRIMRMLALGLALAVGLTVSGVTSAVADPGDPTIAYGYLSDSETGDALTGLQVQVYSVDPATPDAESVATALTLADDDEIAGDYQVSLAPGHYWFVASADDHKTLTFDENVDDTEGGYQNLGGEYLEMNTGTLAGTVNGDGGEGYNCANVEFYQADSDPEYGPYSSTSTGQLDEDGAYSRELPVGDYKVLITDGCDDYVSVWVGGTGFTDAEEFTVHSEETTTVTTVLLDNGAIVSGVVRKGTSTTPLDAISVVLAGADGTEPLDYDTTDAAGTYSFGHVAPGDYQLQFSDPLAEYESTTLDITVASSDQIIPAVGLALTPVGVDTNLFRGKVTGPTKAGIGNINVSVEGTDSEEWANVRTKRDGTYSVAVPAGSYKVYFSEYGSDEDPVYQSEWFDNAPTYSKAKTVVLADAPVVVDAELVKNAIISGTITVPAGYQFDGDVTAYDVDGERAGNAYVDQNGAYRIKGLSPGSYKVKASGWAYQGDYDIYFPLIRQYYSGKYTLSAATAIPAGNGAVVTGRNVTLSNKLSAYSAPKVSGTAKKGKKLTASVGAWTLAVDTEYTYQWYRGSTRLSGQTARTHTVSSSDVGKKLRVVVTGSNRYDDYLPGTAVSAYTATVKKK